MLAFGGIWFLYSLEVDDLSHRVEFLALTRRIIRAVRTQLTSGSLLTRVPTVAGLGTEYASANSIQKATHGPCILVLCNGVYVRSNHFELSSPLSFWSVEKDYETLPLSISTVGTLARFSNREKAVICGLKRK